MLRRSIPRLAALLLAIALVALGAPASGLSPTVTVRVQITDAAGGVPERGQIVVYSSVGDVLREVPLASDGHVDVTLPRGDYYVAYYLDGAPGHWEQESPLLTFDEDETLELSPISHELSLDFTNQNDEGLNVGGMLICTSPSSLPGWPYGPTFRQYVQLSDGQATTRVPTWGASSTCSMQELTSDDGAAFGRVWDGRLSAYATTVAPGARLKVGLSDGRGEPASSGFVRVTDADPAHGTAVAGSLQRFGASGVLLEQGTWDISYQGYNPLSGISYSGTGQVVLAGDLTKNFAPDPRPLTINVQDQDGSPVEAYVDVSCKAASADGGTQEVTGAVVGSSVTVWGLDGGAGAPACQVNVQVSGRPAHVVAANASDPAGNTVTVTLPELYTVTGTLSAGAAGPLRNGGVAAQIETDAGLQGAGYANVDSGPFSLDLVDGSYRFVVNGSTAYPDQFVLHTGSIPVTADSVLAFAPDLVPLRLRVRNADGTPATAYAFLSCSRIGGSTPHVDRQSYSDNRVIEGGTQFWGLSGLDASGRPSCVLGVGDGEERVYHRFSPAADGTTELTVVLGPGTVVDNSGPPADDDGVSDTIEAAAPNGGDGNHDGTADHLQGNVTSLPGNGGDTDQPFVTIAAPAGTTLSEVSTLAVDDPSIADTPPPSGVELPHGLASFTLEGLVNGSTHVVSIFPSSTDGLTSYAKLHGGAWSLLPADRVAITASRIDITLTDGGIGDADGEENGVIVDPGGPAAPADDTPPTVVITGVTADANYVLGSAPAPGCTASDAETGVAGSCSITVTGGNANGVGAFTATATATDLAGNTGTVSVPYKVIYGFDGFLATIRGPNQIVKAGSTVPVKFRLLRSNGSVVAPLAAPQWLRPERGGALSSAPGAASCSSQTSSGDRALKTGDNWHYNWSTKNLAAGYWYRVGVRLDDGTTRCVTVGLR